MLKFVGKIVVLVFLVIGFLVYSIDFWGGSVISKFVENKSGYNTAISSFYKNVFLGKVGLDGLIIQNPDRYSQKDFVDLNELLVDLEVGSLFKEELVLDKVVLDLEKLTIERTADGKINAKEFGESFAGGDEGEQKEPAEAESEAEEQEPAKSHPFLVKEMNLRWSKIKIIDYKQDPPLIKEYDMAMDHTFYDLRDYNPVLRKVKQDLANLAALFIFDTFIMDSLNNVIDMDKVNFEKLGESIKGVGEGINDTIEDSNVKEGIKDAVNAFKGLFGGDK